MLSLLRRVAVDVTPMRESRDFRLIALGQIVSSLGTQAALVALPFQIFVLSHSPALVGLLGAFELGPMIVVSLLAGALADRTDRRRLLATAQLAVTVAAGALGVAALAGHPPVVLVMILGGLLAGGTSLDSVSRGAIIPNVLSRERLRTGLAFNYGLQQVTGIIGPALGGLLIALAGVSCAYLVDSASCLAMLVAALAIAPQRPVMREAPPPVGAAIAEGLRFVKSNHALSGSFAIDLVAMTFGMPRALFAVLALTVYHAGASGTGLLYAAVALGGTLAVLTSGWIGHARRLGRIVILAVLCWGAGIAGAGLVRTIAPAIVLLAIAGYADGVSAFCRSTINQTVTPDALRGRMSSVFSLVVTSGPRLGDIESGLVAGLTSALTSVLSGGIACIVGVGAIVWAFPELAAYDEHRLRGPAVERDLAVEMAAVSELELP
ncbi:MAG TPA: MFS transporter [Solirubrobacteraceae bacterium]|nr:MFS transporter [Solirubrobacteraceae bacterium]